MQQPKATAEAIENQEGSSPVLRSSFDDLSVWQSVRRFKYVGSIAMVAAFSASLDGYRKSGLEHHRSLMDLDGVAAKKRTAWLTYTPRDQPERRNRIEQGLHPTIRRPGHHDHRRQIHLGVGRDPVRRPDHRPDRTSWSFSCCGITTDFGLQLLQYATEGYGRKPAMMIIWVVLTAVCSLSPWAGATWTTQKP